MAAAETTSFKLSYTFECLPKDITSALTDYRIVSSYLHAPVEIDAKVGGKFAYFGGNIHGEFTEFTEEDGFTQKWRFKDWPEDHYSILAIKLKAPARGVVEVSLSHTDVPLVDKFGNRVDAMVKAGWTDKFFRPISKTCGYLLRDE